MTEKQVKSYHDELQIRVLNKRRMIRKKSKQRYSVYRAELNQHREPNFKNILEEICDKKGLEIDSFIDPNDKKTTKWWFALRRYYCKAHPNVYGKK